MSEPTDALYEAQGRFDQIRAYIESGCATEATTEAEDGVLTIARVLESIGFIPNDPPSSDTSQHLYEAQGTLDQIRIYLEAGKLNDAKIEAEDWISNISEILEDIDYAPPSIPGLN